MIDLLQSEALFSEIPYRLIEEGKPPLYEYKKVSTELVRDLLKPFFQSGQLASKTLGVITSGYSKSKQSIEHFLSRINCSELLSIFDLGREHVYFELPLKSKDHEQLTVSILSWSGQLFLIPCLTDFDTLLLDYKSAMEQNGKVAMQYYDSLALEKDLDQLDFRILQNTAYLREVLTLKVLKQTILAKYDNALIL